MFSITGASAGNAPNGEVHHLDMTRPTNRYGITCGTAFSPRALASNQSQATGRM